MLLVVATDATTQLLRKERWTNALARTSWKLTSVNGWGKSLSGNWIVNPNDWNDVVKSQ